jgi:hypothetical protein
MLKKAPDPNSATEKPARLACPSVSGYIRLDRFIQPFKEDFDVPAFIWC